MAKLKVTFCGGVKNPTGSNFLLEFGNKKILVDCGLFQGEKVATDQNRNSFLFDPKTIDALFVTHGHLDHVGRIPKLVMEGFSGPIFSTLPTRDVAELIMLDSVSILAKEALKDELPPIYQEKDVIESMRLWKTAIYHEELVVHTDEGDIKIKFLDSGHILGSSMIHFSINGTNFVFTGDLGNTPSPLLCDTEILDDVNYLFIESVYGDRNHEDTTTKIKYLKDTILTTLRRGGTLIIPAFSVERTQELLYYINQMVENKEVKPFPIYLDSPLGINITKVYKKYKKYFNQATQKLMETDDIFQFPGLIETETTDESKSINLDDRPKVIIAGSGMSNGGRVVHHEYKYLPDPKSTILMVGYQSVGTLGRLIQDGLKKVRVRHEEVEVRAEVRTIGGFSAHKDSNNLLDFVIKSSKKLKKVFVILGEPKSSMFLAQKIKDSLPVDIEIPESSQIVEFTV
jgi:metallo-beta-lactamase family protein